MNLHPSIRKIGRLDLYGERMSNAAREIPVPHPLAIGARDVFDEYVDEWSLANGDNGRTAGYLGAVYPLNHPAGFNGGSYYVRLSSSF